MGRPAGTPNRRKERLLARLAHDFPGYHPVIEMVKIALDPEADQQLVLSANKEVAKYLEPQLKAVEHTGGDGGPLKVTIHRLTDCQTPSVAAQATITVDQGPDKG